MDAVSSAAQFFSAPASGGSAGAATGVASLFGNGGGVPLGAGAVDPTGKAAEVVASFENLLAALINGDGASVQDALKDAVADGAVTMEHGKLMLGPALQQIAPPELATGKPMLDQLIAGGKAAPAAALLAMLLNGDGDGEPIQIDVPGGDAPAEAAPDLAGAFHIAPAATPDAGKTQTPAKTSTIIVETIAAPSAMLTLVETAGNAAGATDTAAIGKADDTPAADGISIAAAAPGDAVLDTADDDAAHAAREQAALDLMAALLAQQPAAPVPTAPKPEAEPTLDIAAVPTEPAPLTDLPAEIAAAPKPAAGTLTPAPEKEPDFESELAAQHPDALAPKHLAAAKNEPGKPAATPENLVPVAARPANDGAPAAQPSASANSTTNASAAAAPVAGGETGGNANANSNGQQQPEGGQRQPAEIDLLRSGAVAADSGRASGSQDFASQLASASRGSHGGGSGPHLPAVQQVAVQIRRAVIDGDDHLNIQLKPAELGRIDVRLHFTGDGRVSAHVTADNVATLDLMQRDTRGLERALQDAGLQTDSGSLSFNLRGDNRQGQDQQDNRGAGGNARFSLDGPVEPQPEDLPAGRWVPAGRVDVRV